MEVALAVAALAVAVIVVPQLWNDRRRSISSLSQISQICERQRRKGLI